MCLSGCCDSPSILARQRREEGQEAAKLQTGLASQSWPASASQPASATLVPVSSSPALLLGAPWPEKHHSHSLPAA